MSRVPAYILACFLFLGVLDEGDSFGQCMLANPSFELSGTGEQVFGGWNQFGSVGSSSVATHGTRAARISGPNGGGWDVSAFWQRLETGPGDRWSATVRVWHSSQNPLSGDSRAILNIEWRNGQGELISYESHVAADASTPPEEVQAISVESGEAPEGTVTTHFLLGVLQSPQDPAPDVYFDQATFDNLGPPTLDERQWFDFPGGRSMEFAGRTWRVKGPGFYGPGPNHFSDAPECTWVDVDGRLHLTIRDINGTWSSTEVALEEPLGYGDYIFTTLGRLDGWHPNVVLGLFLWQYGACFDPGDGWWNPYNEIDVEFSRWGNPGNEIGQFVAQPYDFPGNISRFEAEFVDGELTSHAFRWLSDRVEFRSWRGGPWEEGPETLIHSWTYTGPHIPRPEQPRVHMNLWQFSGPPDEDQEAVIDNFAFVPADAPAGVVLPSGAGGLLRSQPNPFRTDVRIRYRVRTWGPVSILIHDVSGRIVRTLTEDWLDSGEHHVLWDGRNDEGEHVASGVYLCRLRAGGDRQSMRLVLLK